MELIKPPGKPNDYHTPITPTFIKDFAKTELVIDCPIIELRQMGVENPRKYSGPGMITLTKDGYFQLKMFPDDCNIMPFESIRVMSERVPGQLIPTEHFYAMEAADVSRFIWGSDNLLIDFQGHDNFVVITAKLDFLLHRVSGITKPLPSTLSLYFFEDLTIPFTAVVKKTTESSGQILRTSWKPERTQFEVDHLTFDVQAVAPDEGAMVIAVKADVPAFPRGIENKIVESLRFATFNPIAWGIMDKRHDGAREVIVAPRKEVRKGIFNGPLSNDSPKLADDFWRLFTAYYRYVENYDDPLHYHPLSSKMYEVIFSESTQPIIIGLLLCISVEGILKDEFKDLAQPTNEFIAEVDQISKKMKAEYKNMSSLTRMLGALDAMKGSRPGDKLRVLLERGLIKEEMLDAWTKLRNSLAHANVRNEGNDFQKLLDRCCTVYSLLNILVFMTVKYEGQYRDYSEQGWPLKDWPPTKV